MYGMPSPTQYANYAQAYSPYAMATPGAMTGMPTAGTSADASQVADPTKAAAAGWDANNYYTQYWGGEHMTSCLTPRHLCTIFTGYYNQGQPGQADGQGSFAHTS